MGYRIDIDHDNCLNCAVCMDVCPVEALDMSRPTKSGVEAAGWGLPLPWMMEHPVQVGECIGCGICIRECPTVVMTLATTEGPTPLLARQGPINRPPAVEDGWIPLSAITRESLKREHVSPWGDLFAWRTAERPMPWQVWRTMVEDVPEMPKAPCQVACPAGTDAGRYVGLVAEGRYDDAYAVAAEVNPFPSVCGWICTAPCEAACRRGVLDEPISIRTIKRFAAERGHLPPVDPPTKRRAERVAIVGGGPAGMSAAYYLARLGYQVTVFEAMPVPGGMMAIGIPEYRLPREVLRDEIQRIVDLGVELRLDSAMGRDFTLGDLEREGFKAVFLATGASKSRRLGVPGDGLAGVIPATVFLKQVNLGEHPRLSGAVIVVGGGSTAIDAARSALRSGAASVTIVYRRGRTDMPAQAEEIEAAEREGIAIRAALAPVEVIGRDGRVVAMRCAEQRPTGQVERGRATWAPVPGFVDRPAGRHDPRGRRRGARPVHPPRRGRHRGQRLGRDRGRSADAGDRPGRNLRRWRRRFRPEDDHRRGRVRAAGRGLGPRVPRGRPRRRGGDHADGPLQDPAGAFPGPRHLPPAAGPPAAAGLPGRVVQGGAAGVRRGRGARRGVPLLPLRRRLRLLDSDGPGRPRPGRPAGAPRRFGDPRPGPATQLGLAAQPAAPEPGPAARQLHAIHSWR